MSNSLSNTVAAPGVDWVSELSQADCLALWGIRAWVKGHRLDKPVEGALVQGMSRAGVAAGAFLITQLMTAIVDGHRRPVEINCTCHTGLSPDENRLLDALAMTQRGDMAAARELLADMLDPRGQARVAATMAQLTQRFREAGLHLAGPQALSFDRTRTPGVLPAAAGLH